MLYSISTCLLFQQKQKIVKVENEENDAISLNNEVYILFHLLAKYIYGSENFEDRLKLILSLKCQAERIVTQKVLLHRNSENSSGLSSCKMNLYKIKLECSQICRSSNGGPSLVCQQCDMILHSFAEFGYHMRTHLISKDCEQKCNLCNATFTDPIVIQLFSLKKWWI